MALLEVRELFKSFGGNAAVAGFDGQIAEGEIVGLVGPNGAGKSTIFNLITGYLRADRGSLAYCGERISGLRPDQIARKGIGRTFQVTRLFLGQTVTESVLAGHIRQEKTGFWQALFNTGAYREEQNEAHEMSERILDFMGLSAWKETLVEALPCGIQRFLGIAQALMSPVGLLLLDEPMTGLNADEMAGLLDKLKAIREKGVSILIIEHHMQAVMSFCDRVIVINFGRKIAEGTPAEIARDPLVVEAYLGHRRGVLHAS